MSKKRILSFILLFCTLFSVLPVGAIGVWADGLGDLEKEDAMEEIESVFTDVKIGETQTIADDGYIGIPVELSVYFDRGRFTATAGYGGTPVIVYVVNTYAERVGTDTDAEIIQSMLERGYIVTVLDYRNDIRAVSPELDWSVQGIRNEIKTGAYFIDPVFPSGTYHDNYVVPAGCDVSLYNVFWQADKHGVDGTLDKIVEIWNTDFRSVKGEKLVKWVYPDGTRKATLEKAKDGSAPVWYDAAGKADADGEYTKVKYTVAEAITDCVNPDGSFIDLDLYIHIVYPTNPEKAVPVMSLANSSGYMANSAQTADRPHMNGFLFNGYAGVIYDYFYVPMAKDNSFGYYDGANSNGSLTGDSLTYSVQVYNDKLITTAAMRFLRYLALSDGDTYNFDINAFGVYGNSKGGYISFLGERVLQSPLAGGTYADLGEKENAIDLAVSAFTPFRYLDGHHGETRYHVGKTEDQTDPESGFTVKGGEKQPWLTYGGEEIISGAQLTYVGNGADSENVTAGRMPMIVSVHLYDSYNAAYGESNRFANMCRTMNIPSVIFEVPLGHTFSYGEDMDYGIDAYDTIFSFVGYYLKKDPVSVLYTTPLSREAGVNITDKITVKFAGEVSAEEITRVTVTGGGETLEGSWSSEFGDTEWTFTPTNMKGGVTYTVNVPASLKGKNGAEMGEAYTSTFITEYDNASAEVSHVTTESGTYFSFTAPSAMSMGANGYAIRFFVANNAANVAELYAIDPSTYDPASPDESAIGELVGKVNLKGSGSYELDVTDYVAERAGEQVVLLLKAQKTAGTAEILYIDYESGAGNVSKDTYVTAVIDTETFGGNAVYKLSVGNNEGKFECDHRFYAGINTAFSLKNLLGSNVTAEDYGRQFVFSIRIYDTVSRVLQLRYDTCTDRTTHGTRDYDFSIIDVRTKANEWITVELPYTVYDTDYGKVGENNRKDVTVRIGSTGDTEIPVYVDDLRMTETVTDIQLGDIVLAEKNDGGVPYKSPESEKAFALYSGETLMGEYGSWKAALSAYKSGYVLKLRSDYTLTDSDLYSDFCTAGGAKVSGSLNVFHIDLNGYTITCANTKSSLLWLKSTSTDIGTTEINICGGAILLGRTALISYESSSATAGTKVYGINLENVYIGTVEGAPLTQAISTDTVSAASDVEVNVKLAGCTLDFTDDKRAKAPMELLPAGTGSLDISYTVDGGSIRLSSLKNVTVQNDATVSEFVKMATGEYTTLILPASKKADSSSYLRDDGYSVYAASGETTDDGFAIFRLSKSANSTKYGVIDEAYTDATAYPWLIFSGGLFRGGYSTLIKASNAVTALVEGEEAYGNEAQILLRRDYTNAESGDGFGGLNLIGGTVVLDLGGYTFTRNGSFLDFKSNTNAAPYDSTVIIKNGAIRTMKSAPCDFQYTADQVTDKTFNITVENVTFGFADTCKAGTSTELIWVVWDNKRDNAACNGNITFNDCIIDLDTNAEVFGGYTAITLFKFYDTYDRVNVDLTVNGGGIIAPDMSHVTFMNGNSGSDTVTMGRGSDGKFMTATLTGEGTVIGDNFTTVDGETRAFTKVKGSDSEYELTVNKLVTEYGTIPLAYADTEAYPFALFADGKFVSAHSIWGVSSGDNVFNAAKNLMSGTGGAGKTAYILLRRDFAMTDDVYYNLSQIGGTLVIDLGGNTFYVGKNDMFYAEGKLTSNQVHDTSIVVMNGSIRNAGAGSVVELRHAAALTSAYKKTFHMTFEEVTFGLAEGNSFSQPLFNAVNGKGNECYYDIELNGCTFDYATVKPSTSITLFHLASSTDTNHASVTVNGGKFMFDSFSGITFYKLGAKDTLTFGKGADGAYPTLETPSTTAPNKTVFSTADGNAVFIETADDGETSTYRLTPVPYSTENMSKYADAFFSGVDYPFAVFFDGKLVSTHDIWGESTDKLPSALNAAKKVISGAANAGKTSYIMMRSDYTVTETDIYHNLSQVGGTLVLDMNGFTMTTDHEVFFATAKSTSGVVHPSEYVVKNGTFLVTDAAVIKFNDVNSDNYTEKKTMIFRFEGVSFRLADGYTTANMICYIRNTGYVGSDAEMIFDGCTFDLSAVASTAVTLLNVRDSRNVISVNALVKGGSIIANTDSGWSISSINAGSDTVAFETDGSGKYTTFTVALDYDFRNSAGERLTVSGGSGAYTLVPHTHSYKTSSVAPTCTAGGYTKYTCSSCGDSYKTNETSPLGHRYDAAVTAPTCTEGGYTTYTCSVCGDGYVGDYTEATGHSYDDEFDVDCNICGEVREVETPVTVIAEGVCGVNTTWVLTSDGVLTISGNGDTEDYLVSITKDQPYRAYQDQITKVVFEEGILSIGRGAFYGFTAITEVVFPESLIAIHEYAFFGCSGIKSVSIPENTTYIGMYALRKTGLTSITFADAEGWTFANGIELDVSNALTAFKTATTYKQTCIKAIAGNGEAVASGTFGSKDEFSWTLSSTGVLTVSGTGNMPKFNVNTTPWYGYRGAIRSVVIEEGVTSVGRCAFHTCRAITSVTLPESLETIAEYAFYNCQFLTEATIPANVTRIEIFAFRKCDRLETVTFAYNYGWSAGDEKLSATEITANGADMLSLAYYAKIWTRDVNAEEEIIDPNYFVGGMCNTTVKWTLTYTDDSKTAMKLTVSGNGVMPKYDTGKTPWYDYLNEIVEIEVGEGITEIGRCSFYGLKFVNKVTLPSTLTTIGDYAFNGCFSLKSIEIPESVTHIGTDAFKKTGLSVIPTV